MPVIVWGEKAGVLRPGNTYRTDIGRGTHNEGIEGRELWGRGRGTRREAGPGQGEPSCPQLAFSLGDEEVIGGEIDFSDFKGGWSLSTFLDRISWSSWFS